MMNKELREAIKHAEIAQYALQEIVDARRSYFDERSERWQDGDKGQDFSELTDLIDELHNAIEMGIADIEGAE